jgi:hypothetical protein
VSGTELTLAIFLALLAAAMFATPYVVDAVTTLKLDDANKIKAYASVVRARRSTAPVGEKTAPEIIRRFAVVPAAASVIFVLVGLLNGQPPG